MENINIYDNIEKAKISLLKACKNPKLGKYITIDKIEKALSSIVICKTPEAFVSQIKKIVPDVKSDDFSILGLTAFQDVEGKKIILRHECDVDIIVHEIVHYISLDDKDTGIIGIGNELISDNYNYDWNNLNKIHIDVLNEAMTHYITQEILPEKNIEDAYKYGGIFLKEYANSSGNMDKILQAYFNKDKNALDFIAKDINKENCISWHDIIEASGIYQYTNMGVLRNFAKNFEKCNTERKRIEMLIDKIWQRGKDENTR